MTDKPHPDRDMILRSVDALFAPDDVIEVRAFHKGRKRTDAGYFDGDHRAALADAAVRLNAAGAAVYVTLNRIDPQLLSRYCNRIADHASSTATDANVTQRRWLLLDFDPVRPKDTAATNDQLAKAKITAQACRDALKVASWPDPFVGESGNGYHLLYPLDLPNDSETRDLIKGALAALAAKFDDEAVKVDQSVFNAGRITKLYGTVATKGDHTPAAPWRLSRLLKMPARAETVTIEQLRALTSAATPPEPVPHAVANQSAFDLGTFLLRLGIDYDRDNHEGRDRYKLAHCPFNTDHGKGESAIFHWPNGKLGFKCQHAGCADKAWQDVREKVDGPKASRKASSAQATAPRAPQAGAGSVEDEEHDSHRNAPRPDPACLYGLVGDIATAGSATTEANPYAIALNAIVYISAALGRGPFLPVGNTWHHARIFSLHIGRTSRGRKGDATSLVKRIDMAVRRNDKYLAPQVHSGGLSSREGLVIFIHDGFREGKNIIEPVHDKRLWVIESEFANILHQSKRDGNTLSAALRDAWDGVSIKPATKSNRVWASHPHIALSGAVTPSELRGLIHSRELTNGFANRFLMIFAERVQMLPFPKATPDHEVDALAERVVAVLRFAGADRPVDTDVTRMSFTPKAGTLYGKLYLGELNDQSSGELVIALLERRAPTLLRLAMLFALCDLTHQIDVPHIEAALAWVRYWRDSVKFVFASADDEAAVARTNDTSIKIINFLGDKGRASRTELTRDCFGGHVSKMQIDAALDELLAETPPKIIVQAVPRSKGNPGAATKFYMLAAKSANSAKDVHPRGFADDFNTREASEVCEGIPAWVDESSQFRAECETSNPPQTRASIDVSQDSHSSPTESEDSDEIEGAI